jgi:choline dehydrogenase
VFAPHAGSRAISGATAGLEPPRTHAYAIAAGVVAPRSRGRLSLRSRKAEDPPAIDLGLLTDAEGADLKVLLAGLHLARRIAATEPLAGETEGELAETAAAKSDDELTSLIHRDIQTIYHPAGTCRMGSDPAAPVDPRLRVRGCEGLWVVDASVMPTVPRGHPNAVVAMIAMRASAWIAGSRSGSGPVVASEMAREPA